MMMSLVYAQQTGATPTGTQGVGALTSFMPMILIFLVFYFLLIRPQQKQQKLHRKMVADAKRGDEIVTSSGIYGKIAEIQDDTILVQVASNVNIKIDRQNIQSIKGYEQKK